MPEETLFNNPVQVIWNDDSFTISFYVKDAQLYFSIQYNGYYKVDKPSSLIIPYSLNDGQSLNLPAAPSILNIQGNFIDIDIYGNQQFIVRLQDNFTVNPISQERSHRFIVNNSLGNTIIHSPSLSIFPNQLNPNFAPPKPVLSKSIDEEINKILGNFQIAIQYLSLGLTIPDNTILFKGSIKYDIVTTAPTAFSLTIYLKGLYFEFNPPLKLDLMALLPNAYLASGSFGFESGHLDSLEIKTDGSAIINLPPAQRLVKKQVEEKIRFYFSVLLNNNIWPKNLLQSSNYNPFKDQNLLHRIFTLQALFNNRTQGALSGNFDFHQLQYLRLLSLVHFEKLIQHPLGPCTINIPKGTALHSFIYLQNSMAELIHQPEKIKINSINLVSDKISLSINNQILAVFKNIKIKYGGEVEVQEVEIKNKIYNGIKSASLILKVGLIAGLVKSITGQDIPADTNSEFLGKTVLINGIEAAILEHAFQEGLIRFLNKSIPAISDKGINLKKALGIFDYA